MITDVEKPLLSDYEVQYDEKPSESESERVQSAQGPEPHAANNTVSAAPASNANWNRKFQKFERFALKIATPISRKASGFGCESFVPAPAEQECQKAARIIKSFSYGYSEPLRDALPPAGNGADMGEAGDSPRPEPAAPVAPHIVTIPPRVIADAAGLLIFTTGRLGFGHISGSAGSGLLVVRDEQGTWGTPVPIQAYSLGGGPLAFGAEVTDRVYVINNPAALALFKNARFELGPEVVLAAGPYGGGGGVTFSGMSHESHEDSDAAGSTTACRCGRRREGAFPALRTSLAQPVYCYMRSRGLYAGLQAEGTFFIQHADQKISEQNAKVLKDALREAERC